MYSCTRMQLLTPDCRIRFSLNTHNHIWLCFLWDWFAQFVGLINWKPPLLYFGKHLPDVGRWRNESKGSKFNEPSDSAKQEQFIQLRIRISSINWQTWLIEGLPSFMSIHPVVEKHDSLWSGWVPSSKLCWSIHTRTLYFYINKNTFAKSCLI